MFRPRESRPPWLPLAGPSVGKAGPSAVFLQLTGFRADGDTPFPRMTLGRTRFETELNVRPDDIDMNQHVHSSRYQDYVLAARYDQMARCYKMPMEEFIATGLGWFVKTAHVEYKRPLMMGDSFVVRTWVDEIGGTQVKVRFEIQRKVGERLKLSCDGWFEYTMVSLKTGRAETIPDWIVTKYSV